jgi:Bacterial Ig domain
MKFFLLLALTLSSGVAFADLNVSSPAPNASVSSPTHVSATVSSTHPITGITVYLDGNAVYKSQNQNVLDTYVSMSAGWHNLIINAWDSSSALFQKNMWIDATSTSQGWSTTKIEDLSGWNWCSQLLNGSVCAAGLGQAVSWMAPYQGSPSLDGSSAQFYLGGSTPYSNALWWKSLGATSQFSHFQYDLWVYVSNPALPETLEFDVNQDFGGHRWIFGTQCNFKDSGRWDLWDGKSGRWQPSAVPCHPFAANAWTHIVWNFERVGALVHYVSLQLNGVTIPVNVYWNYQANYAGENTNIQFQMDGDYRQDPFYVWLNKVTLNAW